MQMPHINADSEAVAGETHTGVLPVVLRTGKQDHGNPLNESGYYPCRLCETADDNNQTNYTSPASHKERELEVHGPILARPAKPGSPCHECAFEGLGVWPCVLRIHHLCTRRFDADGAAAAGSMIVRSGQSSLQLPDQWNHWNRIPQLRRLSGAATITGKRIITSVGCCQRVGLGRGCSRGCGRGGSCGRGCGRGRVCGHRLDC